MIFEFLSLWCDKSKITTEIARGTHSTPTIAAMIFEFLSL